VLVNNNSTDNTVEVAKELWSQYDCPATFKLEDEPRLGLSHAREKGLMEANYEYVVFCDDDNWLDEKYVQLTYEIMLANPEIGALGGVSEAVCEIIPPEWFEEQQGAYAVGKQAVTSGDLLQVDQTLWGAGIVVRKTAWQYLQQANFTSLLMDRTGIRLSSGGDAELCYALRLMGYKLWYDERLHLRHFIPRQRLTWDYCKKLHRGFGEANPKLAIYNFMLSYCMRARHKDIHNYFRDIFRQDITTILGSYKRLLFFMLKDIEGEYYICRYTFHWHRAFTILKTFRSLNKHERSIARLRGCSNF
jgi:glycosyltransferase involved in cell wall biosynthesis